MVWNAGKAGKAGFWGNLSAHAFLSALSQSIQTPSSIPWLKTGITSIGINHFNSNHHFNKVPILYLPIPTVCTSTPSLTPFPPHRFALFCEERGWLGPSLPPLPSKASCSPSPPRIKPVGTEVLCYEDSTYAPVRPGQATDGK